MDGERAAKADPRWVAPIATWLASTESAGVTGRVIESSGSVLAVAEGWHRGPSTDRRPGRAGRGRPRSSSRWSTRPA